MTPNASPPVHRVALVTGGLPLGGSTTFLINLAGELVRRGIPVEVFSPEGGNPLVADFKAQNIPVRHAGNKLRMIFEDRLAAMLDQLRDFNPTVVVANLGAAAFEVQRYAPANVFRAGVIHLVGAAQYDMVEHYLGHLDMVAVVSRRIQEELKRDPNFSRSPLKYLPLGVPICPEAGLPGRNPSLPVRILYVGRLDRGQKRVHLFPEIRSQLCAAGIPFDWTIVGEGPERAFLESSMKTTLPGQTVSFTGSVNYAAVPALLKQHDIFLLVSDYEGLPLSLLEAMGHGLVPVVSDLSSGIPEVVDVTNGLLVSIDRVAGYAEAIIHLHHHREELAAKSAAAHARVKKDFSVTAMTDRWLAAFPPVPVTTNAWAKRWKIAAPLTAKNPAYFLPPMRLLRGLAAKLLR